MKESSEITYEEHLHRSCNRLNSEKGNLSDYDCLKCLNRGGIYIVSNQELTFRECECKKIRSDIKRYKNSGISDSLKYYTFENYETTDVWQSKTKNNAIQYVLGNQGKWFYAGGQVGSGKTHICTAIVGKFLESGKSAKYMLWRDNVVPLKANVNDVEIYDKLISPLKSVDVLYIDDLFKSSYDDKGNYKKPTTGDLNVAFEILNYRYVNKKLITIISCEYYIDELICIDEAIGSRIYERSKGFTNNIKRDILRNYRIN